MERVYPLPDLPESVYIVGAMEQLTQVIITLFDIYPLFSYQHYRYTIFKEAISLYN